MKRKLLCGLLTAVLCFGMALPVCAAEKTDGLTISKSVRPAEGTTPDENGAYKPGDRVIYAIEVAADDSIAFLYPEIIDTVDTRLEIDADTVDIDSETLLIAEDISTDKVLDVRLDQSDPDLVTPGSPCMSEDTAVITFEAVIKDGTPTCTIANTASLKGCATGSKDEISTLPSNEVTINVVGAAAPADNEKAAPDAAAPEDSGETQLDPHNETGDNAPVGAACVLAAAALAACGLVLRRKNMTK